MPFAFHPWICKNRQNILVHSSSREEALVFLSVGTTRNYIYTLYSNLEIFFSGNNFSMRTLVATETSLCHFRLLVPLKQKEHQLASHDQALVTNALSVPFTVEQCSTLLPVHSCRIDRSREDGLIFCLWVIRHICAR